MKPTLNNKQNTFSIGSTYTNSGYFGTFGYQRSTTNNIGGEYKAGNYWRLEAGYNANNILAAAYLVRASWF
jgi:hypothetical protein